MIVVEVLRRMRFWKYFEELVDRLSVRCEIRRSRVTPGLELPLTNMGKMEKI